MKMRRLSSLFYRELYLSRKSLMVNGIFALLLMMFGIMVSFSSKYGNLTLVPENYKEMMEEMMVMFSVFMPVYACAGVAMSVVESWQFECDRKWRLFRKTTPISGMEYVGVKYLVLFLVTGICAPISILYMWGNGLILGTQVSWTDIKFVLTILCLLLCGAMIFQLLIILLGSLDRAGIAFCLLFVPGTFLGMEVANRMGELPIGEFVFKDMIALLASYLPQIFAVFVVLAVVSFFLSVKLYERREK